MKPIRVMIVDDHAVVRSGLCAFLQVYEDLEMVGEAQNGQQAIDLCALLLPDVIIMDLMMPVKDGIHATREICRRYPHTQVIALTSYKDENTVCNALEAGANSYLLKNISAEELALAIRNAAAGRNVLAPEATQALIQSANHPRPYIHDLTDREREILDFLVKGFSNPEIAGKLMLSRGTIKFHVSNILTKLGASSRTEAVAMVLQHRLI